MMKEAPLHVHFPEPLREVARRLREAEYACFVVGGAVRSIILKKKPSDWDIATDAAPEDVITLFPRVLPTGIKHGTVTVLHRGYQFEVTTFRVDGKYSDSRRPDTVSYTQDLEEDLKRRDFTVNAMAIDPVTGNFVDPHDGTGDCKRKILRAIGNPVERFTEDGLRILRAVRFSAQLAFEIDSETINAMKTCAGLLRKISAERVRDEFVKIIMSERPSNSIRFMEETGILKIILPELSQCVDVEQKGYHSFDVFTHLILSCDAAPSDTIDLRLAALLHDIGKPSVKTTAEDGSPRFLGHEQVSERIAAVILRRLKFPVLTEKHIRHLIECHMFNYDESWSDAAVRRFVVRVGRENIEDILSLRTADGYGTTGKMPDPLILTQFRKRLAQVLSLDNALSLKDLKVDGNTLETEAGIPKGPVMGRVLSFLFEAVLDDPLLNSHEKLVQLAKNFYQSRIKIKD